MNNIFEAYARIEAPADFTASVRIACRRTVSLPVERSSRRPRLILLLAALILLAGVAAAAAINWMADDLFTETDGFMLPSHEWGSSSSLPREETLSFYDYTADVRYQYENDALISVDIIFNRQNQPSGVIPQSLVEQITADMTRLYGKPEDISDIIDPEALQQALRRALGVPEPELSEADEIRNALLESGADSEIADRASHSLSSSADFIVLYRWNHQNTSTAAWLSVSYDDKREVRVLELSLAYLNR